MLFIEIVFMPRTFKMENVFFFLLGVGIKFLITGVNTQSVPELVLVPLKQFLEVKVPLM